MNNKWDKLKKFIFYRFYDLNNIGSSDHGKGMMEAFEEIKSMMDLLEGNETMQENDWIKCSVNEAITYWTEGHDVRCEIREDEMIYPGAKGAYDVMKDQYCSSPCRMELSAGVWSYRSED